MRRLRLPEDGQEVDYRLVRHPRSRNVRLTVTADGLRVSAPPRVALREIERVVRSHAPWVRRQLARFAAVPEPPLVDGSLLPLLGGEVELGVRAGARDRWTFRDGDARLAVECSDPDRVDGTVEAWYRDEARRHLAAAIDHWAPRLRVAPGRLTIRDGRSRWGSCSATGGISLSWRLVMAPPEVGEYVVVHELAHLREMNHSRAFWAIVAEALPDYRGPRAWLKEHGDALSRRPPRRAGGG